MLIGLYDLVVVVELELVTVLVKLELVTGLFELDGVDSGILAVKEHILIPTIINKISKNFFMVANPPSASCSLYLFHLFSVKRVLVIAIISQN